MIIVSNGYHGTNVLLCHAMVHVVEKGKKTPVIWTIGNETCVSTVHVHVSY